MKNEQHDERARPSSTKYVERANKRRGRSHYSLPRSSVTSRAPRPQRRPAPPAGAQPWHRKSSHRATNVARRYETYSKHHRIAALYFLKFLLLYYRIEQCGGAVTHIVHQCIISMPIPINISYINKPQFKDILSYTKVTKLLDQF